MKIISRIVTAAIAITIAALPVTQASARDFAPGQRHEAPNRYAPARPMPPVQQHRPRVQPPRYQAPQAHRPHYQAPRMQKRKWANGNRFQDWKRMPEVRDYHRHGLKRPSAGQRWVKVDNDYLLVSIASGIIASIIAGR